MRLKDLRGEKLKEWQRFLRNYGSGKLAHHSRSFLHTHVCQRLGVDITIDHFGRYLKEAREKGIHDGTASRSSS